MGNSHKKLNGEARLAATKFDSDEIEVLEKTWQDMADRSNGKGIDKDTFLQYFPLNGLLGERLFAQFDKKKKVEQKDDDHLIDFDEFITGLAIVCRGTVDEKIHFLFNMYDVSNDQTVSKQELEVLLNHIPKAILGSSDTLNNVSTGSVDSSEVPSLLPDDNDTYTKVDSYTNHGIAEKAFEECDLRHEGKLNFEEFKMWVEKNPAIMDYMENIVPYSGPKDATPHVDKKETLPHMKRIASRYSIGDRVNVSDNLDIVSPRSSRRITFSNQQPQSRRNSFSTQLLDDRPSPPLLTRSDSMSRDRSNSHVSENDSETEETVRSLLIHAMEITTNDSIRTAIGSIVDSIPSHFGLNHPMSNLSVSQKVKAQDLKCEEGYLWKRGHSFLHFWSKRYYLLATSCLYYYNSPKDIRCKGVIFLSGSIVESLKEPENELKGYYGFEILHLDLCTGVHHRHDKRTLYARSAEERDRWVTTLQHAANVIPIEEEYCIGLELGRGRFSIVKECVHKTSGKHYAVKIIDKSTIEQEDKSLLRTEIAVLKLVNHPNIIHMEGLYESRQHIYIVMEMLKGGELFERIVGRPRFSEEECYKVIRPLLESVAYLHDLGIVHRDLKPENILCGENLEDLKIADFGLSKMILPTEKMDSACGTLSYVAPEVLTLQGYGREADLWSVGVIMFLLLCGKLPFDGDDQSEIIRLTVQADLKTNPNVWNKLSEEVKSLIKALLNKNPKERISARDALRHPYILNYNPRRNSVSSPMSIPPSPTAASVPTTAVVAEQTTEA